MEIFAIFIVIFLTVSAFIKRRFYSEKNKETEYRCSSVFYNHNYDDEEDDEDYNDSEDYDTAFNDSDEDDDIEETPGGIPFGDGNIYMTDDNDFLDEFGDDIL